MTTSEFNKMKLRLWAKVYANCIGNSTSNRASTEADNAVKTFESNFNGYITSTQSERQLLNDDRHM